MGGDQGPETTLIVLHVPKTAGTTLSHIIARPYPAREAFTSVNSRNLGSTRHPLTGRGHAPSSRGDRDSFSAPLVVRPLAPGGLVDW